MAIRNKADAPDPTAIYKCVQSFVSADANGAPLGCSDGARLRGDDERVVRFGRFFVPDGSADSVIHAARVSFEPVDKFADWAGTRIEQRRVFRCTTGFKLPHMNGIRLVEVGNVALEGDPVLEANRDKFEATDEYAEVRISPAGAETGVYSTSSSSPPWGSLMPSDPMSGLITGTDPTPGIE